MVGVFFDCERSLVPLRVYFLVHLKGGEEDTRWLCMVMKVSPCDLGAKGHKQA